jgi:hypothetical protein
MAVPLALLQEARICFPGLEEVILTLSIIMLVQAALPAQFKAIATSSAEDPRTLRYVTSLIFIPEPPLFPLGLYCWSIIIGFSEFTNVISSNVIFLTYPDPV